MKHVMVDLETMSLSPNAAILSIGAVEFGSEGLGEEFYARIRLDSAMREGGEVSASTIMWWLQQSDAARAEFAKPACAINHALEDFSTYLSTIGNVDEICVWGNGAAFDNVVLASAYHRLGWTMPWKYWNDRCFRTVKCLLPQEELPPREGTHHHALDDAKYQAQCAVKLIKQGVIPL